MVDRVRRSGKRPLLVAVILAILVVAVIAATIVPKTRAAVVPVKFAVWGDTRPSSTAWPTSQSSGFKHMVANLATRTRDFNIAVGDYIDIGTSDSSSTVTSKYTAFKQTAAPVTGVPTYWTKGNHEVADGAANTATLDSLYRQNMGISGTVDYYTKLLPGGIHLIVLDTEMAGYMQHIGYVSETSTSNSPQAKWLVSTLKGIAASDPKAWIIVAEHRPIADPEVGDKLYGSAEKTALKALFAKYGVDLAVFGDTHYYRRHVEPTGPTYLVQGTGGAPSDPTSTVASDSYDVAKAGLVFGYTMFTLDDTGLHGTTYEASSSDWNFTVRDTFSVPNRTATSVTSSPSPAPTATTTPTPTPTSTAPVVLSLGKTAVATSSQSSYPARYGNDGSTTTRWAASSGTFPQRWTVDLGANATVSQVKVVWYGGTARAYKYQILTSTDGTTYTLALDRSGNTTGGTTTDSLHVAARYVRVKVTGVTPTGGWAAAYEVTVSGTR